MPSMIETGTTNRRARIPEMSENDQSAVIWVNKTNAIRHFIATVDVEIVDAVTIENSETHNNARTPQSIEKISNNTSLREDHHKIR